MVKYCCNKEKGGVGLLTFEEMYRQQYKGVFAFLYKLCGNFDLAEELTQETFFQAYRSYHRFKGESSEYTWLVSIAKHIYYKYLRKNKLSLVDCNLDFLADRVESGLPTPEEAVDRKELIAILQQMVDKLPEKYKDVVLLRAYGDLPFKQVAAVLNISENSAKVIYFRAKKLLMEEIEDEFGM